MVIVKTGVKNRHGSYSHRINSPLFCPLIYIAEGKDCIGDLKICHCKHKILVNKSHFL